MKLYINDQTFERFYLEHVRLFTEFGLRIIPDMDTVRDVVQEAFINLWDRREMLQSHDHSKAFLYKSIHNRLLNVLRNRQSRMRHTDKIRESDDENSFRDLVIEIEMYELLCRKIDSLPEMQQKVIWLHADGLSNHEIAQKLGIGVNTVLTHKQRAKEVLRGYMKILPMLAALHFFQFFPDICSHSA